MKFRLNESGEMALVNNDSILDIIGESIPRAYIVDIPKIKETIKIKSKDFLKNGNFAAVAIGGGGVFWKTFLIYIFPWLTDIAKVYCAIRIAQAFYQEKRGGRDDGTGISAIIQYGKWYLLFAILPFFVELIDEIGNTMYHDLQNTPVNFPKK